MMRNVRRNGNELMRRFDLSLPVIQAPMAGGGDTAELVGEVANAGGLGFIGAAYLTPEQIIERGRAVRQLTSRPFGINLFAPIQVPSCDDALIAKARQSLAVYYQELGLRPPEDISPRSRSFDEQFGACLESGAVTLSFTFGLLPDHAIARAKSRGLYVMGTATTVDEARMLQDSGVDAVIAQGVEAGGHRGTFAKPFDAGMIGLMALVPQIVDAVQIPVIASGGVMDGRGIVACLSLGAEAVQMGTAFLLCHEAGVSDCYKAAIMQASEDETRLTRAFSGRPARGVANRVLREFEAADRTSLPFPLQNALTRPMRSEASRRNLADYLSLWSGQGTRMARRLSAGELITALGREMSQAAEDAQHKLGFPPPQSQ
jgi:nitronate monooxygenase